MKKTEYADYKYVMQDTGALYLGAKYSYGELMDNEAVPFKLKAVLNHYVLKEASPDTTLESQLYYMEPEGFLYETFRQLKMKVKVQMMAEKKNMFGQVKTAYQEKIFPLKDFCEIKKKKKKASGMMLQEIIISKLGLMTFSV